MARKPSPNQAVADAKFVFKGTIKKSNASNLEQVPRASDTAIVHVDEIVHAPAALAKTLGHLITVKLGAGARAKAGDQLLFHANGWLFGKTIAVESLKQEKSATAQTMLAAGPVDPVQALKNNELRQRVTDADVVVEGQVSSVHLPQAQRIAGVTASTTGGRPVSEHDPKWREAVIDVQAVHKGKLSTKQVVVRFPSSTDVQWHRAPKFKTGDRGLWLLHSESGPSAPVGAKAKAVASSLPKAPVYTALHPMDFQPATTLHAVAPMISAAVGGSHS